MKFIEINGRKFSGPDYFSDTALYIALTKYATNYESSVEEIFRRVSKKIWPNDKDKQEAIYQAQLRQEFAFNSPVYLNMGIQGKKQQSSACFILGIQDNLESITNWWTNQTFIFKSGGGIGSDLSKIREHGAPVQNGRGIASGPLSWAKVGDAIGMVIRSGSVARRAATMLVMDISHPDIEEFIVTKSITEDLIRALEKQGYGVASMNSSLYDYIYHQQANRSVRINNEFIKAVRADKDWDLISPYNGEVRDIIKAKALLRKLAESIYSCGDPGVQFSDTINNWNTIPNIGRIEASNPCGEFLFIDNSSCNLASINILKFYDREKKQFRLEELRKLARVIIESQDKLIDISEYPTVEIEKNTRMYRPLGLGITNLGALLMVMGLPYDAKEARLVAASLMALLTAWGYEKSEELGAEFEAELDFESEAQTCLENIREIIDMHISNMYGLMGDLDKIGNEQLGNAVWYMVKNLTEIVNGGRKYIKNAQITALAPCGTISFLMDASTTGIEPAYSLVYEKELAYDNKRICVSLPCVRESLISLGYDDDAAYAISNRLALRRSLHGLIKDSQLPIFATAINDDGNQLSAFSHLLMLAALQHFVSGGISKTVNLPASISIEEIEKLILQAHALGIKGVTFYRDKSKVAQVMYVTDIEEHECWNCGSKMILSGSCWSCHECGESSVCS